AVIVIGSAAFASTAYHAAIYVVVGDPSIYLGLGLIACVSYCFIMNYLGMYELAEMLRRDRDTLRTGLSWAATVLFLTVVLFVVKAGGEVSRGAVASFAVMAGAGLLVWRRTAVRMLQFGLLNAMVRGRRVLVIGTQHELGQYDTRDLVAGFGLEEVERVVLPPAEVDGSLRRLKALVDEGLETARQRRADEIVLVLPWTNTVQIEAALERIRTSPLPVRLLPDRAIATILRRQSSGSPRDGFTIEVQRAPLSTFECATKRVMDIV
ncbi:hypothetical protein ABTU92_30710, partial [Rhodoplanes sp. SY1]